MGGPLGTLIVVVLKARNLPNKQRIGKQDPYATCTYLSHRKRTKTDKRGGQHPVWDDELRFEIYENAKDVMPCTSVSTTSTGGVAPVKSQELSIGAGGNLGVRELKIAVYADDPRDPDLIGEGKVDLSDTLKKGEFDDWVTINNKGKYQGEVYLEMTFYSAKPPPEKRQSSHLPTRAGVFEASSSGAGLRPSHPTSTNGKKSPSPLGNSPSHPDAWAFPSSLRVGVATPAPHANPSTGKLPLPSQAKDSGGHSSLISRQRSSGSLSIPMPTPYKHGVPGSPSRPPSRHQSFDEPNHLAHSVSSLSLSHNHLSPRTSPLNAPCPSDQHLSHHENHHRHHRHSFSGQPHIPAGFHLQPSPSGSAPNQEAFKPPVNEFPQPNPHYAVVPHCLPQPSRTPIPSRRPLPVPGGSEFVHRPTSAWGEYHPPTGPSHRNSDAASLHSQQHPPVAYVPFPLEGERPSGHSAHPAGSLTNPVSYLPPASQALHFLPNHSAAHPSYTNLPPPPPGQAPVPIHEVMASGRPLPRTDSQHIPPQSSYHPHQSVYGSRPPQSQSLPTRAPRGSCLDGPYPSQSPETIRSASSAFNPTNDNVYDDSGAPPESLPHHSHAPHYRPYQPEQLVPASLPPPPTSSQLYYQTQDASTFIPNHANHYNPYNHLQTAYPPMTSHLPPPPPGGQPYMPVPQSTPFGYSHLSPMPPHHPV